MHSLSEIIELNETFNMRVIWRVCNPREKLFIFQQKILLMLYNKDGIIFLFLIVYKNQLKRHIL